MATWRQCWPRRAHVSLPTSYGSRLLRRSVATLQSHDPLRILFCGADEFSIASLKALDAERIRNRNRIASIDVFCRPPKRVGRGLKAIRDVPIAETARKLQLPLHQRDGFKDWEGPRPYDQPINLIIAVSFGLFIPSRILNSAKYGGLNVHPSMLPDLHGPAPLHHTLLQRRSVTGVTVQTLHPKHFDRGSIIAQTSPPGIEHGCTTVAQLRDLLAARGAEMLSKCIEDGSFTSVSQGDSTIDTEGGRMEGIPAPKITPDDCHIAWEHWTSEEVMLRHSIIGPLWSFLRVKSPGGTFEKRVIWSAGFVPVDRTPDPSFRPGQPFISKSTSDRTQAYLNTIDGRVLQVDELTVDGQDRKNPVRSAKKAGLLAESIADLNDMQKGQGYIQLFTGDIS